MRLCLWWFFGWLCYGLSTLGVSAGGSGLNVVVVVNQRSTNSVQLGNYYCARRQVPPQNLLRLTNWSGGNVEWTRADFTNDLVNPLFALLSQRQWAPQIDYVLLSMDIPYRVTEGGSENSTTAALFYGFKADTAPPDPSLPPSCSLPPASSNSYAFSEAAFRAALPDTAPAQPFLAMMLTASNLPQAQLIVDQGVAGDGSFPTQAVYLAKTTDVFRNVRYQLFDDAVFDARLLGVSSLLRTNQDSPDGLANLLGYQTGLYQFQIQPNTFVPGAMADSLTSYGGVIFTPNDHTTLLAFLNAGASGSYGTVVEPCNYLEKFPSPLNYFYQARGFSLAECYFQCLQNPYQGLLIGEPLAAPFARRAAGAWTGLPPDALLAGLTNLGLQFTAADAHHPLRQVDLFLDGAFQETITNLSPAAGNLVSVTLNGQTANYPVPANATLQSVTSGLADLLNASSNQTGVATRAIGDRLELHSFDLATPGGAIPVAVGSFAGTGAALTTFVTASRTNFLDSIAFAATQLAVSNAPLAGDWLQLDILKTNGARITLVTTNSATNGTVSQLVQDLVGQVNGAADLQSADGVVAEDFIGYDPYGEPLAAFTLRARSTGPGPSQIEAVLSGAPTFLLLPGATNRLNANLSDLEPRNHLYLTTGVTNLALSFPLDTTTLPDGHHELTAVAYEGSHVRTQTLLPQTVVIRNTPLSATFTTLVGDTNTAVEATLAFAVTANTNAIASIELFSTGGSLGVVANQASATFSITATNLDLGLHPFYAVVTASGGAQYRTETKWIRLVGTEPAFPLTWAGPPPALAWPAVAGRRYDILGTDSLTKGFQLLDQVTPTNDAGQWADRNPITSSRYYRVRTSP